MGIGQLFDFLKVYNKSYDFPFFESNSADRRWTVSSACHCATSLYIDRGRNRKRIRTNAKLGHTRTHTHSYMYALSKLCPSQIWNSIMESDEKKRITTKKVLTHVPESRRGPNFTLDMRVCDDDGGDVVAYYWRLLPFLSFGSMHDVSLDEKDSFQSRIDLWLLRVFTFPFHLASLPLLFRANFMISRAVANFSAILWMNHVWRRRSTEKIRVILRILIYFSI